MEPESSTPGSPPTRGRGRKWLLLALLVGGVAAISLVWGSSLTLENLARQETVLREWLAARPVAVYAGAFLLYVAVTGFSLPGATVMTLAYGWFFGFWRGLLLVSFASTTGATVAFLLSRYFFRDLFQRRFEARLQGIREALEREGAFYLFTLRMIPAVPFFVINVVMGLTSISPVTFWWVSQLGMLPATAVFVYAGATVPELQQLADPAQLRIEDVADFPRLAAGLQAARGQTGSLVGEIAAGMSAEEHAWLRRLPENGQISLIDHQRLVRIINRGLRGSPAVVDQQAATRQNRARLQAEFPALIRPPQPILKPQLFWALVLIGVLPWLLKQGIKLLHRRAAG